jgi:hypothetical protein
MDTQPRSSRRRTWLRRLATGLFGAAGIAVGADAPKVIVLVLISVGLVLCFVPSGEDQS